MPREGPLNDHCFRGACSETPTQRIRLDLGVETIWADVCGSCADWYTDRYDDQWDQGSAERVPHTG
jgi:hypothetical protein